jgi:hypothetical protein
MMDGAYTQVNGFQTAERSFHSAELFVAANHIGSRHGFGRDIGTDHVDAVQLLLACNRLSLALLAKAIFFDVDLVVLSHVEAPQHTAHTQANDGLAA